MRGGAQTKLFDEKVLVEGEIPVGSTNVKKNRTAAVF